MHGNKIKIGKEDIKPDTGCIRNKFVEYKYISGYEKAIIIVMCYDINGGLF